jgi:hypothetical protein
MQTLSGVVLCCAMLCALCPRHAAVLGETDKIVKASSRRIACLNSNGQKLTAKLLLAPRERTTVAVLSPVGDVLRAQCIANGEGVVVQYGDRDVVMALSCEGAYCSCDMA